jgi:Bacteriocin-protection, YdeI or OmpD-Associated/Domain of unknown function (DUF1905)
VVVNVPEFEGVLQAGRGGGAYVDLPPHVLTGLNRGTRLRVRGRLNGVEFRSSTMPTGDGRACLGVHKATREAAGARFGDPVRVEFEVDATPREVVVPAELTAVLDADPLLRATFDRLAPSRRRELAEGVAEAKKPETKQRRIARIVEQLR